MLPYFKDSAYDTPSNHPRHLLDRLFLNTRVYFVAGILSIINQARILANRGVYDNAAWVKSSIDIAQLIEGCGGRFHLRGLDNIASDNEPVVFVSNHMSTLETFVFPGIIEPYKHVTYVVKESLVSNSFFGPVMRSRDPIVVTRDNPKQDFKIVMEKGKKLLNAGTSIVVFPQSTRTTRFEPEHFNTLGVKLARAAKVKIVPVAIKTDFWGNGSMIKDFGPINRDKDIYMVFGKPMIVQSSGNEEHQKVIEFIQSHLKEWQ